MTSRFLIALAAVVLFVAPVQAEQMINKIAAVVNGDIVTLYDLKQAAVPELKKAGALGAKHADSPKAKAILKRVLDAIVEEKLFMQEAEKRGLKVGDDELENELRKIAQKRGLTLAQAKEQIQKDGLTVDAVKERLRTSILRKRLIGVMVGRTAVITKEEVADYYEKNKDDFSADAKVEVSLLIFAPEVDSVAIHSDLSDGKISFEEAVQKYSVGPAKEQGGYLGELGWKDVSNQMRTVVEKLEANQLSDVLTLGGSPAVIKLHSKTKGALLPLEEVEEKIEAKLRKPRLDANFKEFADKLRDNAVVDIRL